MSLTRNPVSILLGIYTGGNWGVLGYVCLALYMTAIPVYQQQSVRILAFYTFANFANIWIFSVFFSLMFIYLDRVCARTSREGAERERITGRFPAQSRADWGSIHDSEVMT